jgi:hypothetical protein
MSVMILGQRTAGWLFWLMAAGLLVAGWWPFKLFPHNNVAWHADPPGLHFSSNSIAYTPGVWSAQVERPEDDRGKPMTVEFWLRAESSALTDCFPILNIYDGRPPPSVLLCQWHSDLLLLVPDPSEPIGFAVAGARDALGTGRSRFIAVTTDRAGTAFYVDGVPADRFPGFVLPARAWTGYLVLGASVERGPSWTGSLFRLAIFSRVLTDEEIGADGRAWTNRQGRGEADRIGLVRLFDFTDGHGQWAADHAQPGGRLLLPSTFKLPVRQVLALPWNNGPYYRLGVDDILINLLGFVPFGFAAFAYCRARLPGGWAGVLAAIAAGTLVSLVIEVAQAWLPGRYSSALDFVLNSSGTAVGVAIALSVRRRLPRPVWPGGVTGAGS